MKALNTLLILATLAACAPTRGELVAAWVNECQQLGITPGLYMAACVNNKEIAYNHQVATQAAAASAYLGQLQRQQAPQRSQQAPSYDCSTDRDNSTTCKPF